MHKNTKKEILFSALLLCSMVSWGLSWPISKILTTYYCSFAGRFIALLNRSFELFACDDCAKN